MRSVYESVDPKRLTVNVEAFEGVLRIVRAVGGEVNVWHDVIHGFDVERKLALNFVLVRLSTFAFVGPSIRIEMP